MKTHFILIFIIMRLSFVEYLITTVYSIRFESGLNSNFDHVSIASAARSVSKEKSWPTYFMFINVCLIEMPEILTRLSITNSNRLK